MRVERLDGGAMSASAAIWRAGEDPERQLRLPVPAYLVESERERILIDTGLHPGATTDASFYENQQAMSFFTLELAQPVVEQIDPATISRIILTHLHFDHAGGLSLFPASIPIVVQRREWEAGRDRAAVARNFFHPRDYLDDEREVILLDGDHDLLGDGSIELLLTPGHTPGHQSVRLGEGLILAADVAYFASTLDDRRFAAFGDDLDEQGRSAERLRVMRAAGPTVIPGHDPELLAPGPVDLAGAR
jgi:glyoxylase-like metal-dependent hydrolase (beta-lactamase superfamily II)